MCAPYTIAYPRAASNLDLYTLLLLRQIFRQTAQSHPDLVMALGGGRSSSVVYPRGGRYASSGGRLRHLRQPRAAALPDVFTGIGVVSATGWLL